MLPFIFTPFDLLLIPAFLFAMWAQHKVKSAYKHFSQIGTRRGLTGAQVAAAILRDNGITPGEGAGGCAIEPVRGEMTDHYDPRGKVLRLSEGVFGGRSIAALGIAAHEVGHAIQDAQSYTWLHLRGLMYPVTSIGSTLAFPLFFIGFLGNIEVLMSAAILFFTGAVIFTVVTLPVEFDASRRALRALESGGYLDEEELAGARNVLRAAAMTYVASTAMAMAQLLRLIMMSRARG